MECMKMKMGEIGQTRQFLAIIPMNLIILIGFFFEQFPPLCYVFSTHFHCGDYFAKGENDEFFHWNKNARKKNRDKVPKNTHWRLLYYHLWHRKRVFFISIHLFWLGLSLFPAILRLYPFISLLPYPFRMSLYVVLCLNDSCMKQTRTHTYTYTRRHTQSHYKNNGSLYDRRTQHA